MHFVECKFRFLLKEIATIELFVVFLVPNGIYHNIKINGEEIAEEIQTGGDFTF